MGVGGSYKTAVMDANGNECMLVVKLRCLNFPSVLNNVNMLIIIYDVLAKLLLTTFSPSYSS